MTLSRGKFEELTADLLVGAAGPRSRRSRSRPTKGQVDHVISSAAHPHAGGWGGGGGGGAAELVLEMTATSPTSRSPRRGRGRRQRRSRPACSRAGGRTILLLDVRRLSLGTRPRARDAGSSRQHHAPHQRHRDIHDRDDMAVAGEDTRPQGRDANGQYNKTPRTQVKAGRPPSGAPAECPRSRSPRHRRQRIVDVRPVIRARQEQSRPSRRRRLSKDKIDTMVRRRRAHAEAIASAARRPNAQPGDTLVYQTDSCCGSRETRSAATRSTAGDSAAQLKEAVEGVDLRRDPCGHRTWFVAGPPQA